MSIEPSNQTSQNTSQNDGRSVHEFEARFNRLKDACGATNDSALARCLDITQGSIGVAKKRLKIPSGWIEQIAVKYGVSTDWLFFGIGQKLIDKAHIASAETQKSDIIPEGEPQWMSAKEAAERGYSLIPKVRARLSAGTGSLETEGAVIGLYAFKTDSLHRKGHPSRMVLMDVTGDSMEPVLMDSDSVLIDESQQDVISGGLYAVGIDSSVLVKYVDTLPGKIVFRSRNERYNPIEVSMGGDLADMVRIIGRVVWSCREYVR